MSCILQQRKRDSIKTIINSGGFPSVMAKLSEYKKKRKNIFVVQKHDATRLHYDFRLEVNGVLKSWAIPKGPSENPDDKRLAVMVEDHPPDYADFEGTIPEGQYGAGSVEIWDRGSFENIRTIPMGKSIEEGKVEIKLEGKRLKGDYALIRTKLGGKEKNWLFFRMKEFKTASAE